jgi:hypothetical protein
MSAKHEGPGFAELFIRGLRMALLLTFLTQALHKWPPFGLERLDHFFTAAVVSRLQAGESAEDRSDDTASTVQLVELGADLRAMALEDRHPDATSVLRLDGVRPLDRAALTRLLNGLAACLDPEHPRACSRAPALKRMPSVLAIDMDLAPLTGDDEKKRTAMLEALKSLREHVQVVVIALGRTDADARKQRDEFIKLSQCTRLNEPDQKGLKGLFFASPWLLLRPQEGPLQYLTDPKPDLRKEHGDAGFAGIGTLAFLAEKHVEALPQSTTAARKTLTTYCELVHNGKPLPEDGLPEPGATGKLVRELQESYHSSYFNWPLLNSEAFRFSPLSWSDNGAERDWDDQALGQLSAHQLSAPILMLTVDAGGSNDKFYTPGAAPRPVTGATLHALQILSLQQPLHEAHISGAAADFVLGALMVLLSCCLHQYLLHPIKHTYQMPALSRLLGALLALLLVYGFHWLGVSLAAWLMKHCQLWFNPLYVLLGLAMHAYAEGWSEQAHKPFAGTPGMLLWSFVRWPPTSAGTDARSIFALQCLVLCIGGVAMALH